MQKIIKCAEKSDTLTMRFDGSASPDTLAFQVESPNQEKVSEFTMKLMEIDAESLGIPTAEYKSVVSMPSADFTKLCRDMSTFGENVTITVKNGEVIFQATGDIGTGSTTLKPTMAADLCRSLIKKEEEGAAPAPADNSSGKKKDKDEGEKERNAIIMETKEEVSLNFALKHLVNYCKAGVLSDRVKICISSEDPLLVEYRIQGYGYIRFYLAPKVDETEEEGA